MGLEDIRRQILDENKREGSNKEYDNDADLFYTAVITPVRRLRDAGAVQDLEELQLDIDGESRIAHVWIGAVNLNF